MQPETYFTNILLLKIPFFIQTCYIYYDFQKKVEQTENAMPNQFLFLLSCNKQFKITKT